MRTQYSRVTRADVLAAEQELEDARRAALDAQRAVREGRYRVTEAVRKRDDLQARYVEGKQAGAAFEHAYIPEHLRFTE